MTATVVLVHGAMHTPWICGPLRERLDARGIAGALAEAAGRAQT